MTGFVLVLTLFLWLLTPFPGFAQQAEAPTTTASAAPKSAAPQRPQPVFVGIYLNKVVNLDLKLNTYWLDFYIWFRWKGPIDPTTSYEFMNTFEKWGETNVAETENSQSLDNGWNYREFHVEVQAHNPFYFESYPLDQLTLRLSIEDKSHNSTALRYIPDTLHTQYNPEIFISGWKVDRQVISTRLHAYETNFGQDNKPKETYSQLNYDLKISRHPHILHLFKLFLPVGIILVMVFVIFFIPISFFDSRVEIAVTGLLSLIALQMVLADNLPPVGYLTLADRVYYMSYFIVMCALIETVWVYFSFKRDDLLARRIDRVAAFVMLALTPLVLASFFTVFKG